MNWLSFFDQTYSTPLEGLLEPKMTIYQTISIGRVWRRRRRTLIVFLLDNRAIPRDLVPPATPRIICKRQQNICTHET